MTAEEDNILYAKIMFSAGLVGIAVAIVALAGWWGVAVSIAMFTAVWLPESNYRQKLGTAIRHIRTHITRHTAATPDRWDWLDATVFATGIVWMAARTYN